MPLSSFGPLVALSPYIPKVIKRRLPDPRACVYAALPKGGVGAEIGVWKGDFSDTLLYKAQPAKLHLVDPWRFFDTGDYAESLYGGADAHDQSDMDAIYDGVRTRYATQIAAGQIEVHRALSVDFAGELADGSLDWVYIDGDHTHEGVLADLEAFYPKVRSGGIISGDDYANPGWWHDGVTTAVNEFVRTSPVTIEAVHLEQFVLRKA